MKNLALLTRHRVAPNHIKAGDVLLTVPSNPTVLRVEVQQGRVKLIVDRAPDEGAKLSAAHVWVGR